MLQHAADKVRRAGRYGDDQLVHVNRRELGYLTREFGEPTEHPETGLPEFWFGNFLKSILPMAAPALLSAIMPGALGDIGGALLGPDSPWGATLGGGLVGGLTGLAANGFKDPLKNGLTGALMGAATPSIGKALGFDFQTPFSIPQVANFGGMLSGLGMGSGVGTSGIPAASGTPLSPLENLLGGPTAGATPAGALSMNAAGAGGGGLGSNMWIPALALGALGMTGGSGTSDSKTAVPPPSKPTSWANYEFPTQKLRRKRRDKKSTEPGEYEFYEDNELPDVPISVAKGGSISTDGALSAMARRVKGRGDGRSDEIPAMLSNKEYVMDGETMALLGNGDPDSGADRLDEMRVKLRKHKGRAMAKGKLTPNAKRPEGYLSGGRL